jgi:[protein-PII] uridylyltransferase
MQGLRERRPSRLAAMIAKSENENSLSAEESLEDIGRFLKSGEAWLRRRHGEGLNGMEFCRQRTHFIDRLLQRLLKRSSALLGEETWPTGISLLAMGGYGREELSPSSDIDLLILHAPGLTGNLEPRLQAVLHPLWDFGLAVGHTVQTPKESLRAAQKDPDLFFSFLDARWIAGDKGLPLLWREDFERAAAGKETELISEIRKRGQARHARQGDSVFVLEPDIKEGKGGLRDHHSAFWAARLRRRIQSVEELPESGLLSPKEWQSYSQALNFLWRVRNQLHYQYGTREDRLSFDDQEAIASSLGYRGENPLLATESFLKDYFRQALQVHRLSWNVLDKCLEEGAGKARRRGDGAPFEIAPGFSLYHGRLTLGDPGLFSRNPLRLWKAFEIVHAHGVELDPEMEERIAEAANQINDRFRTAPESVSAFVSFFERPGNLSRVLEAMHETGFLARFLPEFERVHCQVQYDRYHIYPVDVHSLYGVREIEALEKLPPAAGSILREVVGEIRDPGLLKLAALFHDLGKGEGSPHALEGEKIAAFVGERLGLSAPRIADLRFLVREHLNFVEIAHRRDLNDENLILRFAGSVGTGERLKMLYLLCVADLRAVGPASWSAWKDALMRELFLKTLHLLEKGEGMGREIQDRTLRLQSEVMELLRGQVPPPRVSACLASIPPRHYAVYEAREIGRQILMAERLREEKTVLEGEEKPEEGCDELTVAAEDEPGLFAKISGVLTANHLNILSAEISTWESGVAVDSFRVQNLIDEPLFEPRRWGKLQRDLERVLKGEVSVETLVESTTAPLFQKFSPSRRETRVRVDNESSDFYTILEVYTHDRPGLLYRATRKLFDVGLSIAMARISTKVDQVVDVFYVQDLSGSKIEDPQFIEKIGNELREDLEKIPVPR